MKFKGNKIMYNEELKGCIIGVLIGILIYKLFQLL